MKALVVTSIWVWWVLLIVLAWVHPLKTLGYNTVPFNTGGATANGYSRFVNSLRSEFGTGPPVEGIPVTVKGKPLKEAYLLVELTAEKSVTLVLEVADLYVLGYRDKDNQGKNRFNYLSDVPKAKVDEIFKGEKDLQLRNIGFGGSYIALEGKAQARQRTPLGVPELKRLINLVSGNQVDSKTEATFFLVSIQMVAEAARFKYIQNMVGKNGISKTFLPDTKVLDLEKNWGKISDAIHRATKRKFVPELVITPTWKVTDVDEIKPYMGLLKFKG